MLDENDGIVTFRQGMNKENIQREVDKISRVSIPGFCISIDICQSTEKKKELMDQQWLIMFYNTWNFVKSFSRIDNKWEFIKFIGDELMFYCPLPDQNQPVTDQNPTAATGIITKLLDMVANKNGEWVLDVKATVCFCQKVIRVRFKDGFDKERDLPYDYLGLDIDRTFRIAGEAKKHCKPNTIIFDQAFSDKLLRKPDSSGWETLGPCPLSVKDFDIQKVFYITLKDAQNSQDGF